MVLTMENGKMFSESDLDLVIRNGRIVSDLLAQTPLQPSNTCR